MTVSKEDALATLAANNGNAKKTARDLGISRSTLREWAGRNNAHGKTPSPNMREEQRTELAGRWQAVAQKSSALVLEVLEGANPQTLSMKDARDLAVVGAVATDKALLLTGQATNRTETAQIVYVQPSALRDLSIKVLEGELDRPVSLNATTSEGPQTGD